MTGLLDLPLRRPRLVLCLFGLFVLALAPGLRMLTFRLDGRALVPTTSAVALDDQRVRERFDQRDSVVVVIESLASEGIYDAEFLARFVALDRALGGLPGLGEHDVTSLAREASERVATGTLDFLPWLEPLPESASDLAELRRLLADTEIYRGTLVSQDAPASALSILVGVPTACDRDEFISQVARVVDEESRSSVLVPRRMHVVGAAVAESRLGEYVVADLLRLLPAAFLLMAFVFWLAFRSSAAVVLPLIEVGCCLVATFGMMGWTGTPIYLTLSVLPVIVTAVGVSDELHVFHALVRIRREHPTLPPPSVVARTLQRLRGAIFATSLTTAAGFLSFAFSPLRPVQAFGLCMAFAILVCLAFSLFALPAALTLLPTQFWQRTEAAEGDGAKSRIGARLAAVVAAAYDRRRSVRAVFVAVLLLAPFAIARIDVQDGWIDNFPAGSEFRRSVERVEELFGGTHVLHLELDTEAARFEGVVPRAALDDAGLRIAAEMAPTTAHLVGHDVEFVPLGADGAPLAVVRPARARIVDVRTSDSEIAGGAGSSRAPQLLLQLDTGRTPLRLLLPSATATLRWLVSGAERAVDPRIMGALAEFEARLAALPGVGRAVGPMEHLATMRYLLRSRAPGAFVVPESFEESQHVLSHYERVRGGARLRRVFSERFDRALVTLFLRRANYADTRAILGEIDELARELLVPLGIRVVRAGDVATSQAMIESLVGAEMRSIVLALLVILAVGACALRSLLLGMLCVLPALSAVVVIFAGMGLFGIPLGVATSMFAAMTLGIGVDHAMHLSIARRRARQDGVAPRAALVRAAEEAMPAIFVDLVAVGLGFGLLVLSGVPANARLGAMMVAALGTAFVTTLVALPAVFSPGPGRDRAGAGPGAV